MGIAEQHEPAAAGFGNETWKAKEADSEVSRSGQGVEFESRALLTLHSCAWPRRSGRTSVILGPDV